jgi:hypothetical protein
MGTCVMILSPPSCFCLTRHVFVLPVVFSSRPSCFCLAHLVLSHLSCPCLICHVSCLICHDFVSLGLILVCGDVLFFMLGCIIFSQKSATKPQNLSNHATTSQQPRHNIITIVLYTWSETQERRTTKKERECQPMPHHYPYTTIMAPYVWKDSPAREVIMDDLLTGIMPLKSSEILAWEAWDQVYSNLIEFHGVEYDQYYQNLRSHRRQVEKQLGNSKWLRSALEHDRILTPRQTKMDKVSLSLI